MALCFWGEERFFVVCVFFFAAHNSYLATLVGVILFFGCNRRFGDSFWETTFQTSAAQAIPRSPVAYMGELMTSLEAQGDTDPAVYAGIMSLLERALAHVPRAVLLSKGPRIASALVGVANRHAEHAPVLGCCLVVCCLFVFGCCLVVVLLFVCLLFVCCLVGCLFGCCLVVVLCFFFSPSFSLLFCLPPSFFFSLRAHPSTGSYTTGQGPLTCQVPYR